LRLLRWFVLPLELACLAAVLAAMLSRLPTLGLFLVPYALWLGLWLYSGGGIRSAFSLEGYDRQPLADFYCVYWPLCLLLLLVLQQPTLWPLAAVFVLWQARFFFLAAAILRRRLPARGPLA
jgi:hypothetical protein